MPEQPAVVVFDVIETLFPHELLRNSRNFIDLPR